MPEELPVVEARVTVLGSPNVSKGLRVNGSIRSSVRVAYIIGTLRSTIGMLQRRLELMAGPPPPETEKGKEEEVKVPEREKERATADVSQKEKEKGRKEKKKEKEKEEEEIKVQKATAVKYVVRLDANTLG